MNRQDIIDMLESIGVTEHALRPTSWKGNVDVFQKFAALVAAKEREACILEIRMHTPRDGRDSPGWKRMNSLIEAINARGAQQ